MSLAGTFSRLQEPNHNLNCSRSLSEGPRDWCGDREASWGLKMSWVGSCLSCGYLRTPRGWQGCDVKGAVSHESPGKLIHLWTRPTPHLLGTPLSWATCSCGLGCHTQTQRKQLEALLYDATLHGIAFCFVCYPLQVYTNNNWLLYMALSCHLLNPHLAPISVLTLSKVFRTFSILQDHPIWEQTGFTSPFPIQCFLFLSLAWLPWLPPPEQCWIEVVRGDILSCSWS